MKIGEFIVVSKNSKDTTSSGTTSSGLQGRTPQDIVPETIKYKYNENI